MPVLAQNFQPIISTDLDLETNLIKIPVYLKFKMAACIQG